MTHTNMANKTAIVTGGSSGIGSAIVKRFIANGAQVISIDLKKPDVEIGSVQYFDCDLTNESEVSQVFKQISGKHPVIDVLCANAGIVPAWNRIVDTTFSDWKKVIDINVNALFLTISHGAKLLKKGSGTIVVTGSINSIKGDPNTLTQKITTKLLTVLFGILTCLRAIEKGPLDSKQKLKMPG